MTLRNMNSTYPLFAMALIGVVWVATALQNRKLYHAFCQKHPLEAQRLIPSAFSTDRHPEQLLFFFRRTSLPMLRADSDLWRLRQRLKLLLVLSACVPLACMGFFAFSALSGK
jgi:hypothetical protein